MAPSNTTTITNWVTKKMNNSQGDSREKLIEEEDIHDNNRDL